MRRPMLPTKMRPRTMLRSLRFGRWVALAAVLATVGLVVPDSTVAPTEVVLVKVDKTRSAGVALDDDTVWILGVGSDARPGESMTGTRGDALQLIGMNTRTGAATSIGMARDLYVPIPGYGNDRINAALFYGGPQLLADAVSELIGIAPDYVFVTRFPFFENMVNDIGGISVNNPRPFYDPDLKADGFRAGKLNLTGYGAMAFARIRKSLPGGDFDRSANQQIVLRGIQQKVAQRADEPGFIASGVLSVLKHTQTNLSPGELFKLGHAIAQVDPKKITGCVITGGFANVGGASVVTPDYASARRYGDDAREDATIKNC